MSTGALSMLLLAALVAMLVLLADRFDSSWADEHLFLGWVMLWAVIFAGLALFAGTAHSLATQALGGLNSWSQARARVRSEAHMWDIALDDPRVMADLLAIRAHAEEESNGNLALALTTMESQVQEPEARGWAAYIERVGQRRVRNMHLHYI